MVSKLGCRKEQASQDSRGALSGPRDPRDCIVSVGPSLGGLTSREGAPRASGVGGICVLLPQLNKRGAL